MRNRGFAEEAVRDLTRRKKEWSHTPAVVKELQSVLGTIKKATHFTVPPSLVSNSDRFEDDLARAIDWGTGVKIFRLPYPCITLSLTIEPESDVAQDVLLVCQEAPASNVTAFEDSVIYEHDTKFRPSGDHAIIVYPVDRYSTSEDSDIRTFDSALHLVACDFEWWFDAYPRVRVAAIPAAGFKGIRVGANHDENKTADCMWVATTLLRFLCALSSTHTEEVIQQASPKNTKRVLDGKLPIWETKTLVLKTPITHTVSPYQGGTHASPRQHLRRGHYRHCKSGKTTWVRDCTVGSLAQGCIHKDYRIEAA